MSGAGSVAGALIGAAVAYAVIKEADKHVKSHKGHGLFAEGKTYKHHSAYKHKASGIGLYGR